MKTLLCISFSEEQLEQMKKYAAINGMEVEDFIKKNCLTHCLQQMESIQGQESEASEHGEEVQIRKQIKYGFKEIELTNKPTSKICLMGTCPRSAVR